MEEESLFIGDPREKGLFFSLHLLELMILKQGPLYSLLCQFCFITVCEQTVIEENELWTEPFSKSIVLLAFYTILSQYTTKIYESLRDEILPLESVKRIIIELAKIVLLMICWYKYLLNYKPKIGQIVVTFNYFICTDRSFINIIVLLNQRFDVKFFGDFAHLYIPISFNSASLLLSEYINIFAFMHKDSKFALLGLYFTLYLKMKDTYFNIWTRMDYEGKVYAKFRAANKVEIENNNCEICSKPMTQAWISPCNHIFHRICFIRHFQSRFWCPICNFRFINVRYEEY